MNKILHGDSLEVLKTLEDESVDLLCTDPPYGYSFMGKSWDKALPDIEIFKECLRVLKAGAFAFVMSAPRSDVCSRMAILLEDAGFNISFTPIYWTYASGFPKAMNIGKMVDKRNGTYVPGAVLPSSRAVAHSGDSADFTSYATKTAPNPQSEAAKALDGSYGGFQPKPAVEVVIVATKPTEYENCPCGGNLEKITGETCYSRFFSLDAWAQTLPFLIVPKASKSEKSKGLEDFEVKQATGGGGGVGDYLDNVNSASGKYGSEKAPTKNHHPTVKPLKLMSYLITLGSRPGDMVLDPFFGSGTTGAVAVKHHREYMGIEINPAYIEMAETRLQAVNPTLV